MMEPSFLLVALSDPADSVMFQDLSRRLQKPVQYVYSLPELLAFGAPDGAARPDVVMVDRALIESDPVTAYQTLCLQFDPAPVLVQAFMQPVPCTENPDGCCSGCRADRKNGAARRCFPSLDQIERVAIEAAIRVCDGNIHAAAAGLGIAPSTIYRRKQRAE